MNLDEITNLTAAATQTIDRIQKELYLETQQDQLDLERIEKLASILQKLKEANKNVK